MEEQESPPVRILLVDGWALFRQAVGGALDGESLAQLSKLTQREREVLALLADGSDKNAIARALAISPQKARTHVQNILAKLGLHSRLESAAFARKQPVLQELSGVTMRGRILPSPS